MSALFRGLIFSAGLEWSELAVISPGDFAHDYRVSLLQGHSSSSSLVRVLLRHAVRVLSKSLWLLWKLFAPYVLVRQVLAVLVLQVGHEGVLPLVSWAWSMVLNGVTVSKSSIIAPKKDPRMEALERQMEEAECYEEWREAARMTESLKVEGVKEDQTDSPRVARMTMKTNMYKELVEQQDAEQLEYRLRGELMRKHWGLGTSDDAKTRDNPRYRHALHTYMDTVCEALALIARGSPQAQLEDDLDTRIVQLRKRADFFSETLHSFGRTALMLSGGGRLGLLHLGIVRALLDQKLLPKVISGSSAGSIVAVMLGSYRDEELATKLFDPNNINLNFFQFIDPVAKQSEDGKEKPEYKPNAFMGAMLLLPPPFPALINGLSALIPYWASTGTLLDVRVLASAIRDATGDLTFKEAFERTGRIVNITVSPSGDNDFPMLLNYLTAPRVLLWSASVASCAIPGVFAPVELLAKDMNGEIKPYYAEGIRWADGSVENDLPMQRLSELFNINHFIVSQVNPHARFLAPMGRVSAPKPLRDPNASAFTKSVAIVAISAENATQGVVNFCRDQARSSVKHLANAALVLSPVIPLFAPVRLLGKSLVPILTQKYTGDITIMPEMTLKGMVTILANPSPEDYLGDLKRGERCAWPHISRLRLHVAIEFLLDDCRQSCRRQLARLEQELLDGQIVASNSKPGASPRRDSAMTRAGGAVGGTKRREGIPTASVLNLNEMEFMAAYPKNEGTNIDGARPATASRTNRASSITSNTSNSTGRVSLPATGAGLSRNTSFISLQDKLKARVQSFAQDLSSLVPQPAGKLRHDSLSVIADGEGGNGGHLRRKIVEQEDDIEEEDGEDEDAQEDDSGFHLGGESPKMVARRGPAFKKSSVEEIN